MGVIFNIQKFCTSDGPGIRTTVFLKGCPLKCVWCHNPESQSIKTDISYNAERCLNCGKCVARCPNHCHGIECGVHRYVRADCKACQACVHPTCPAMEAYGYEITPEAIIADVMKDAAFYQNSGGGLTLSGGGAVGTTRILSFYFEVGKGTRLAYLHGDLRLCQDGSLSRSCAIRGSVFV